MAASHALQGADDFGRAAERENPQSISGERFVITVSELDDRLLRVGFHVLQKESCAVAPSSRDQLRPNVWLDARVQAFARDRVHLHTQRFLKKGVQTGECKVGRARIGGEVEQQVEIGFRPRLAARVRTGVSIANFVSTVIIDLAYTPLARDTAGAAASAGGRRGLRPASTQRSAA